MQGWIKLHRKIQESALYPKNREFTKYEAWIDLLLLVNHKDSEETIGNEFIPCKRGQSVRSIGTYCQRWSWSIQKVRSFFQLLESKNMITRKGTTKTTILTICNYDSYQGEQQTNNKQITNEQQTDNKQITTNKNDNNKKNKKNDKKEREKKALSLSEKYDIHVLKETPNNNPDFKPEFDMTEHWISAFIRNKTKLVKKLTLPSKEDCEALDSKYSKKRIENKIQEMDNIGSLDKKYTNAGTTLKKFLENDDRDPKYQDKGSQRGFHSGEGADYSKNSFL